MDDAFPTNDYKCFINAHAECAKNSVSFDSDLWVKQQFFFPLYFLSPFITSEGSLKKVGTHLLKGALFLCRKEWC